MAVKFAYDYGQLYLYDVGGGPDFSDDRNPYLDALDAATQSGLTVGVASGIVDVLMPRQENFSSAIDLIETESAPRPDETADHIVEFDLISTGRIKAEGSGGAGELEIELRPGAYRARLSGFDFDAADRWSYDDPDNPADHYRLEVWPSDAPAPPEELKRWPGYAGRI